MCRIAKQERRHRDIIIEFEMMLGVLGIDWGPVEQRDVMCSSTREFVRLKFYNFANYIDVNSNIMRKCSQGFIFSEIILAKRQLIPVSNILRIFYFLFRVLHAFMVLDPFSNILYSLCTVKVELD